MNRKIDSKEEIRACFREKATSERYATSPDFNLREVEIEYLLRRLRDGVKVLDVGCGNGYSTLRFAAEYDSEFLGIDFVPDMIAAAGEMAENFELKGHVNFDVGDVTELKFPDGTFDVVVSQRCLLNLPGKEDQWRAMREVARVLKPGGRYLMLEGTLQGLRKLNEVREMFALEAIPETAPGHNPFSKKFDEEEMLRVADGLFEVLEGIDRFGMYYFISRVIHPLLASPDKPKYDAPINTIAREICSKIPNYMDMGHLALFVFRR